MTSVQDRPTIPPPHPGERPAAYAERLGKYHVAGSIAVVRRALGQYFTPLSIADFMAGGCTTDRARVRVLDPGAGTGTLVCALAEHLVTSNPALESIDITAYEIDESVEAPLRRALGYLVEWLEKRGVQSQVDLRVADFVLASAARHDPLREQAMDAYDIAIANPPYFKLNAADPRVQAMSPVVGGQANIYTLFMMGAAQALESDGELVAITPRSFCSGRYFAGFRRAFFSDMDPVAIHVFGSRRDAFSEDDVLQENVIMWARRSASDAHPDQEKTVQLSRSEGIRDLEQATRRKVDLASVIRTDDHHRFVWLPIEEQDDQVRRLVDSWSETLTSLGLRVSTGPVVPFRAVPFLVTTPADDGPLLPLFWMQHVVPFEVRWPLSTRRKPQYVSIEANEAGLLLPSANYVLIRRFSAKEEQRRLVAAPLLSTEFEAPWFGIENHLNYVYGDNLDPELAWGLSALLNSQLLDAYFRIVSGNTQVNATELRQTPFPTLQALRRIGAALMESPSHEHADALVADEFGWTSRGTSSDGTSEVGLPT